MGYSLPSGSVDPQTGNLLIQQKGINVADGQTLWTPGMLYNETTSDKPRGNTQATLLASAARTTSTNTATMVNYNHRGAMVFLNITAASGTGGVRPVFIGVDNSGSSYWISTPPAYILATGLYSYVLYPGVVSGTGASQVQSIPLPRTWFIAFQHGDATSYTYSASYSLIL